MSVQIYRVYRREKHIYGDGGVDTEEPRSIFLGVTRAPTPKKAVTNLSYRARIPMREEILLAGDGVAIYWLEAEEVK